MASPGSAVAVRRSPPRGGCGGIDLKLLEKILSVLCVSSSCLMMWSRNFLEL